MRKIELKRPQSGGSRERGLTSRRSPAVPGADTRLGRRCRYGTSIQWLVEHFDEAKPFCARCPANSKENSAWLAVRRQSMAHIGRNCNHHLKDTQHNDPSGSPQWHDFCSEI